MEEKKSNWTGKLRCDRNTFIIVDKPFVMGDSTIHCKIETGAKHYGEHRMGGMFSKF